MNFVISTGPVEKHNAEVRKLIRTHVMLGKNRGRVLPPRKKKNKVAVASLSEKPLSESVTTSPRNFGSDLCAVRFADTVTPEAVTSILRFSSIIKGILYPLEKCIFFDRRADVWVTPLATDPAYLHIVIFSSQYYFNNILPKQSGYGTITFRRSTHLSKSVKLLRERLADGEGVEKISNTTTAVIMSLAGHAFMMGDMKSARNHIEGLYKVFALRGGVASYQGAAKLLVEVLRMDIGLALYDGSKGLFFDREPMIPLPNLSLLLPLDFEILRNPIIFSNGLDHQLAGIWNVLAQFCAVVNLALESSQFITSETYLETMASTFYRLLDMRFDPWSRNEVVRLGLLAFSAGVLLQWRHMGVRYSHFTNLFRICLEDISTSEISPELMIWLLMVGAVGVFDDSDDIWLMPLLRSQSEICGLRSWGEMKILLESFLWVGWVFDEPGRRIFGSMNDGLAC
ncbi:hypothetical protein HYFRA_00005835 [Hymenoscyphus fraxineus]|uniref:Uncharacterized protein n=1 Tax=Hymenoscyphus fraxineus TaxID=746836 RepID=A0A9N9PSI8_9HELO|nr:hypothetical protein HYFRA_00005835 [Hymenoscyphus fraxineus]